MKSENNKKKKGLILASIIILVIAGIGVTSYIVLSEKDKQDAIASAGSSELALSEKPSENNTISSSANKTDATGDHSANQTELTETEEGRSSTTTSAAGTTAVTSERTGTSSDTEGTTGLSDSRGTTETTTERRTTAATTNTTTETPTENRTSDVTTEQRTTTEATTERRTTEATPTTESTTAHQHTWTAVYKTVHHNEEGHYENQLVTKSFEQPNYEDHTLCNNCGYDYTVNGKNYDHYIPGTTEWCQSGGWHNEAVQVGTKITEYQVEERVWVVDKAAYDEQVIDHYECTCGATKNK